MSTRICGIPDFPDNLFIARNLLTIGFTLPGLQYMTSRTSNRSLLCEVPGETDQASTQSPLRHRVGAVEPRLEAGVETPVCAGPQERVAHIERDAHGFRFTLGDVERTDRHDCGPAAAGRLDRDHGAVGESGAFRRPGNGASVPEPGVVSCALAVSSAREKSATEGYRSTAARAIAPAKGGSPASIS